jgi:hypothetical protein
VRWRARHSLRGCVAPHFPTRFRPFPTDSSCSSKGKPMLKSLTSENVSVVGIIGKEEERTMAKGDDIQERLVRLAVALVRVCDKPPETGAAGHVASQLLRSGTSPAPNYAEARGAGGLAPRFQTPVRTNTVRQPVVATLTAGVPEPMGMFSAPTETISSPSSWIGGLGRPGSEPSGHVPRTGSQD